MVQKRSFQSYLYPGSEEILLNFNHFGIVLKMLSKRIQVCQALTNLRGSPCKNRPHEFRKITEFFHAFCVEEVIHKMNKKR
jgi:hypothetical protein